MEAQQPTAITQAATRRVPSASPSGALRRDQYHRAQVCAIVTDLLMAARCGKVEEYLRPLPITRLHMAQRAFREIGATRLASALHAAQFSLTRVGVRVPFAQAVLTLTAALESRTEDVDRLIAQYL
ncbi:MAG: hypothetical protein KGL25_02860 [Gammaproteobacteria bacterium]|nr:hypothetical protein [Gammaproteobacteria bacterium]MDE2250329.1 hypothetical protein [Gammaproteobacteria bacterium]